MKFVDQLWFKPQKPHFPAYHSAAHSRRSPPSPMSSNNPSPPLTDEERCRAESNRLRALAKRKSFLQHNQTTNPNWRISKCSKLEDEVQQGKGEGEERERFRVRFEICGPDSFSIATEAVKGEVYRDEECLKRIEGLLFDLMPTHYTQVLDGGKASVYKLKDYDVILKCLKSSKGIEVEEIPWTTYNVLEKLSHSYIAGKWMPCRPEHLSDEEVDELIAKLPRKLAERLLPFQFDGVKFGLQRGGRCLIADEMGLGKTLQAIAIASCFASEGSILVVCPAILRYSWAEELERWLPCCLPVDIHLVFGHANNPIHLTRCPKVVVISYKMLQHLRKSILELEWTVLIVDESHHVRCTKKKSENGEVKAVLDVATKAKHIILLSGTPSLSRPFDIFHQVNMLWPGLLGKHKYEFAKTYCSVKFCRGSDGKLFQDFSRGARLEELNILLRQTIMIRRLKEHLLVQLPPKRRQIITLSLKRSDIIEAKNVVGVLRDSLVANDNGHEKPLERFPEGKEGEIHRSLKNLTAQELGIAKVFGFIEWLSLHPIVAESDGSRDADMNHVCDKMIIFAHHHKVLDRVQEFICQKGIGFIRIDKDTIDCDRQSSVHSFQSSKEVKVAMIGIKVGYAGLNLSAARSVVFLELPQAPTTLLQAEDRAHRRGQTNAVNIYIFCGKDTSDELSWKKLNRSLQRVSTTTDGKYDAVQQIAVDGVNCSESWGNADRGTYESHNVSVPICEEGDQFLDNAAGNDVTADKDDALGEVDTRPDDALESCRPIPPASLRFAVSKYTGRIHLSTCIPGVDSRPRPLSENFQPDEISADPDDKEAYSFIKSNPECLEVILTFINNWKNLRPFDRRKLLGKPLQLPLSTELICLNESANHDSRGLLRGGSKRRTTPFSDISFPLPSDASWKEIHLSGSYAKQDRTYIQAWSMTDEPLCKLCQNPCNGANAKKPEYFEDLFCKLACYEEYRSRTHNRFLRQELFEVECGICRNCKLDCHKLVKHLKPLSHANRRLYIEKVAPNLVKHKKLLDKLLCDPTEGNAWHADHLVPVYLGGGECRVENMRTLCVACHVDVTAAQCADRGLARKHLKKVMKNLEKCKRHHKDPGCSITDDDALLVNVPGSAYSEMKEVETKETVTESGSPSEKPAAQSMGVYDKGSIAFSIFLYNAKM